MTDAYLLAAVRTPRGKASSHGALAGVSPLALIEGLMTALVQRTSADPAVIDDVVLGCASQTGEQGGNLARTAVLHAGWPAEVSGMTLNRFCSSGLDAVATGAASIRAGDADVVLTGGVESVSRVPMFTDGGPLWSDKAVIDQVGSVHMGIAADAVATEDGYHREQLDAYGARTQERAVSALANGRFDSSLVPVLDTGGNTVLDRDEHVRASATVESLSALEPSFAELGAAGQDALVRRHLPNIGPIEHVHTRGTSPSVADGAGLVLLGSEAAARRLGLPRRARVAASASAGSDPVRMLLSGQHAVADVLRRGGITASNVDVIEFAEAFAALCLKIQHDLGFCDEVFNPNGGTIAMGHAFGATGAILTAGCVDELERRDGRYGVVAVSGAAGSGRAVLLERTS